jgi:hypothetical protein
MLGQTVARILVVITLIVTAHAIKPFSVKNITSHFLYSSRSLAFILPDSARSGFDQANKLALTLSDSLFSNENTGLLWTKRKDANSNRLAMNSKPMPDITADFSSDEIGSIIKAKRIYKKRPVTAASTAESGPIDMTGALVAGEADYNFTTAAMPDALPLLRLNLECALKRTQPIRLEMLYLRTPKIETIYEPKRSGCDKFYGKQTKLIAFVEQKKERLRFDQGKVERSIFTMLECEEEGAASMKAADHAAESQKHVIMRQEAGAMAIPELRHNRENCSNP